MIDLQKGDRVICHDVLDEQGQKHFGQAGKVLRVIAEEVIEVRTDSGEVVVTHPAWWERMVLH